MPLLLTTAALLMVPAAAQENGLQVLPEHPRQGEALFVSVPGAAPASLMWRGKSYPLYPQGQGLAAIIPINPDTPPGTYKLSVSVNGKQLRRPITVSAVKFALQRLTMAAKTARLYNFPGAKREDAIVSGATHVRSPTRLWQGDWALPASGPLSTPWGTRRIRNGRPVGRHKGMDIAAAEGAPVSAPAAGRVVLAQRFKKYGNAVVLDHGQGVTSLYLHMSALAVKKGQTIPRGAPVGRVGHTGVATGPHLHWSVYAQGESVQPLFFCRLSKAGVRGQ